MGLHENLLRGIYAYGTALLDQHLRICRFVSFLCGVAGCVDVSTLVESLGLLLCECDVVLDGCQCP